MPTAPNQIGNHIASQEVVVDGVKIQLSLNVMSDAKGNTNGLCLTAKADHPRLKELDIVEPIRAGVSTSPAGAGNRFETDDQAVVRAIHDVLREIGRIIQTRKTCEDAFRKHKESLASN